MQRRSTHRRRHDISSSVVLYPRRGRKRSPKTFASSLSLSSLPFFRLFEQSTHHARCRLQSRAGPRFNTDPKIVPKIVPKILPKNPSKSYIKKFENQKFRHVSKARDNFGDNFRDCIEWRPRAAAIMMSATAPQERKNDYPLRTPKRSTGGANNICG